MQCHRRIEEGNGLGKTIGSQQMDMMLHTIDSDRSMDILPTLNT